MSPGRLIVLVLALASALPLTAQAGRCRDSVRPLMLATDAAPEAVASARALCTAEADSGDPDATYQLALFSLGLAGRWQPDEALPLIRDAAGRGVSEAQYWLAWQSESGPLLPHDLGLARQWYEQAAAGRHRLALARLAEAAERGELGLPVDPRKALEYRAQIRRCDEENARQPP